MNTIQKILVAVCIILPFAVAGCSTVKISDYPQRTISLSPNIGESEVEKAIKAAIIQNSRQGWIVEKSDTKKVVAGLNQRQHYLQITYLINGNQVSSEITDSRNLAQKKNRIHRNAMKWKSRLDAAVFAQTARL